MSRSRCLSGPTHGLLAAILIAIGVLLLAENFAGIQIRLWDLFWAGVAITAGVSQLSRPDLRGKAWGALLIMGGIWIGMANTGMFPRSATQSWPVFLILGGLLLLWRAVEGPGESRKEAPEPDSAVISTLDEVAVFGEVKRAVRSREFQGGNVFVMFGAAELDLRDAVPANGTAVVEVTAVFGGVNILVPESFRVSLRGGAVFGGYDDKTSSRGADDEDAVDLIISGYALFGGVEIKN